MRPLKIGITGVRGVVGETFTPELAVGFAQAFGSYLDGGRVLVCRDTRPSGPMVRSAVVAGLLASGCEVVDLDVCPTPSMQLAISHLGAAGGIAITAGHNPAPWNALKFVRADGLYLNATQAEELLDVFHQGEYAKATWDRIATTVGRFDAVAHHVDVLRGAFDVDRIAARGMVVAVDCANGACSRLVPLWLEALGCEVLAINDDPASPFPHSPEPRPGTMAQLRAVVRAGHADVGFAHDADGERLGLVTDRAEALSEELTLAVAADTRLRQRPGVVVTNLSTTGAIERIAERLGGSVVRTPVGQAYVSEAMLAHAAVLGGEGSGGVAVPEVHPTHDSAATIGLLLERLATSGECLADAIAGLPRLAMVKHDVPVEPSRLYSVLSGLRRAVEAEGFVSDLSDGVRATFPNGWAHVRASNTESLIRVIVEAESDADAAEILAWARDRLRI